MADIHLSITIESFDSADDLSAVERDLLDRATAMAETAYAPYSKFRVGAAALLENDEVVTGSNQENAAYPSGMCAERVAIFSAGAVYPGVPVKLMAIRAMTDEFDLNGPVTPCGSCRQAMAEYERNFEKNITLLLAGNKGAIYRVKSIKDLLPFGFMPEALKR